MEDKEAKLLSILEQSLEDMESGRLSFEETKRIVLAETRNIIEELKAELATISIKEQ